MQRLAFGHHHKPVLRQKNPAVFYFNAIVDVRCAKRGRGADE